MGQNSPPAHSTQGYISPGQAESKSGLGVGLQEPGYDRQEGSYGEDGGVTMEDFWVTTARILA